MLPLDKKAILYAALFGLGIVRAPGQSALPMPSVSSCREMTSTRPHEGVSYRGRIKNEDYGFTATVPAGQTGWGGVDPSAPFHGFTIFLDPARRSCVVFEVHIRVVDDADVPQPPNGATVVSLGKATGWRTHSSKISGNSTLNNVTTSFSVPHGGDTNDGTIILVSPASEMKRNQPLYDSFVRSLRFGSK